MRTRSADAGLVVTTAEGAGAPGQPASALALVGVSAGYGRIPIVHDVSIEIRRGQIVALVGSNGSGKSTLMKSVIGLLPALSGTILLAGLDVTAAQPEARVARGLGYVPQVNDVFNRLDVRENLEMGAYRMRRGQVAGRIDEILEAFPTLKPLIRRNARQLSGGQRKLVAIARVLMTSPSMLLLDEPTAGLAPQLAEEILTTQVAVLAELGCGVLLVEQRVAEAFRVADHAYVLVNGHIYLGGRPAEVIETPGFDRLMLGLDLAVPAPGPSAAPGPGQEGAG